MARQADSEVRSSEKDDRRLQIVIATLLRGGVLLATCVVCLGAIILLAQHGSEVPHYATFRGEPADLRSVGGILADLSGFRGRGTIQFGLLLLIATPVFRVAASLAAFVWKRDYLYVAVSLIVLTLLLYSIFQGSP
jgi:uncharacterized membrane protein